MRGLLTVIGAFLISSVQARRSQNYEVVLESVEGYAANPTYLSPESFLRIRRTDKSSLPSMTHYIKIIKDLPSETEVEVTIYEKRDNQLVPSWLKYRSNFCDYVTKEKRPIFNELAKMYQFRKCPLTGEYKVENWRPDDHLLPPVLPGPERMMFGVRIFTDTFSILKYGVQFQVDRSKAVRAGGAPGPGRGQGKGKGTGTAAP
ncbi:Nitrate reductase [NADPH] [Frankliniella fusca]|uniref:Nitrate reductase [NADPH] n=1 Tax=Frankliniella fusca TaxID=407009 RepID=A0AAE1LUL3_9NEOP|nr:Nitrate reductase [NADPH] [Frankliniella fusca]